MTSQSFGYRSLARCLISADFEKDKNLHIDDTYKKNIIQSAVLKANSTGLDPTSLSSIIVGNHTAYKVSNLTDLLVLRRCSENIRRCFQPRMKQRNQIIRELQSFLGDGTAYRLYKLDIKAFFESVDNQYLKNILQQSNVSTQTQILSLSFLDTVEASYASGLPRGIGLSSVLSEVYMKAFDTLITELSEVDYYSRFVDDIIIITRGTECKSAFTDKVQEFLPEGLMLNPIKQEIQSVQDRTNGTASTSSQGDLVAKFTHLGYQVDVYDSKVVKKYVKVTFRNIVTDISENKIKTLKTRVSKSFYSFSKDHDFELLVDRLTFLSTNRFFMNKKKNRLIPSGIYYSHSVIDQNSTAITELDRFLHSIILYNSGRVGRSITGMLTPAQRGKLLTISFTKGFKLKTFKRYSPNRMKTIARIFK